MSKTFSCPHCGADVPAGATVCPACGSDEETGWSEEAAYQELFPFLFTEAANERRVQWQMWRGIVIVVLVFALSGFVLLRLPGGAFLYLFVLIFGGGYLLWRRRQAMSPERRLATLRDDLLRKARGDEALVERWIAYERRRRPSGNTVEWMESAADRWERDNR